MGRATIDQELLKFDIKSLNLIEIEKKSQNLKF